MEQSRQENKEELNEDEILQALEKKVEGEPKNKLHVMEQIHSNFIKAKDASTKEDFEEAFGWIKTHQNYLGEKMRDTKEQRDYMEQVGKAIKYLEQEEIDFNSYNI